MYFIETEDVIYIYPYYVSEQTSLVSLECELLEGSYKTILVMRMQSPSRHDILIVCHPAVQGVPMKLL